MASVREKRGKLFFDFRFQGERCREYTQLADTPANRRTMQQVLDKIEAEITLGTFDYGRYFPGSKNAPRLSPAPPDRAVTPISAPPQDCPLFKDFAQIWLEENEIAWRDSHSTTVRSALNRHILPHFRAQEVSRITKADVLSFRSQLGKVSGRNGNDTLSARTINRIVQVLGQILSEAADRFEFTNPITNVKRLKQRKTDINPFTMHEVRLIIDTVRPDYRQYMIVRFFTGMRTGEIHGLKWKHVDFDRRQILVRETWVRGKLEYTKTDGSQREIDMSQTVYEALKAQHKATGHLSEFVFCTRSGQPLNLNNVTTRVWYPLLRHLGLELRRPYQTRHTCATLWLAAGENPEWVARQLGHTTTEMLFRVYSRYVPNLTRRDGSAFDRLVLSAMNNGVEEAITEEVSDDA